MASPKITHDILHQRLLCAFRTHGYDGASLSVLSEATGMQRASLYHRFPGGKEQMAEAVLDFAGEWAEEQILKPLRGSGTPQKRAQALVKTLNEFYEGGQMPCVLETLSFMASIEGLQTRIAASADAWIAALSKLARETGASSREAHKRAEQIMISLQGSLVMSRISQDTKHFRRVLRELPDSLLAE